MSFISKERLQNQFYNETRPGTGMCGIKYVDELIDEQPEVENILAFPQTIAGINFYDFEELENYIKALSSAITSLVVK